MSSLELDKRLKAQPEVDAEFFGASSPSAQIDLRGAQVGGSVIGGPLTIGGGSTFIGGKTTVNEKDNE